MPVGFKNFRRFLFLALLGCFALPGCFPRNPVDTRNRSVDYKELGFFMSLPPDWRIAKSRDFLFTADFEQNGTPQIRLTATMERNIPSLEDYLRLEPGLTIGQKVAKVIQGELTELHAVSSGKFEFKGNTWKESIWLAERRGKAKVFHTYTIPVGLNLVQLHFEFPASLYEGLRPMITSALEGIKIAPPPPSDLELVRAYQSIGEVYRSREMWKEAAAAFSIAAETAPRSELLRLLLGESYFQSGQLDPAEREFQKAIVINPQNTRALEDLADVYFKKGMNDPGIAAVKRAVGLAPDDTRLYLKLGEAYLKENRTQEAIKIYQKLVRRKPESAEGHLGLGKSYLAADLYEQAIIEMEQTLKLSYQRTDAHCILEKAYIQLQSTTDAEREKKLCPQTAPVPAPLPAS